MLLALLRTFDGRLRVRSRSLTGLRTCSERNIQESAHLVPVYTYRPFFTPVVVADGRYISGTNRCSFALPTEQTSGAMQFPAH